MFKIIPFKYIDGFTLNRLFFAQFDSPAKKCKVGRSVPARPGVLLRFTNSRLPQIFNPQNPEHIRAWQMFALHKRAMPITFLLEYPFSTVPEMIKCKLSLMPELGDKRRITTNPVVELAELVEVVRGAAYGYPA